MKVVKSVAKKESPLETRKAEPMDFLLVQKKVVRTQKVLEQRKGHQRVAMKESRKDDH